jgi:hypothetical protein
MAACPAGRVGTSVNWRAVLTQDPRVYTVTDLERLFAALHYVFEQAKRQTLAT